MRTILVVLVGLLFIVPTAWAQDDPRQACLEDLARDAAAQLEKVSKAPTLEQALALLAAVEVDPAVCDDVAASLYEGEALDYLLQDPDLPDGWVELMREDVTTEGSGFVLCLDEMPPPRRSSAIAVYFDTTGAGLAESVEIYDTAEDAMAYIELLQRALVVCQEPGSDPLVEVVDLPTRGDESYGLQMTITTGEIYGAWVMRDGNLVRLLLVYDEEGSDPDVDLLQQIIEQVQLEESP